MKFFKKTTLVLFVSTQSCYTAKQGYGQLKLLTSREPISQVIEQKKEAPERIEKLVHVQNILNFSKEELGLNVGGSYQKYVKLESESVTYVLQVAHKRKLERKTWWFPIVGTQPYLGFFKKEDAMQERNKWVTKDFDTSLGGVEAFSLLGYVDDPLYSSMLDNNTLLELAETIIHECLHRTVYIKGESEFNENLADFVGRNGALLLAQKWKNEKQDFIQQLDSYKKKYEKNTLAQKKFQEFLPTARKKLEKFYASTNQNSQFFDKKFDNETFFSEQRLKLFTEIRNDYIIHMNGLEKETFYENRFFPSKFNNAVFLGYTLYEAQQKPFEKFLEKNKGDLNHFILNVKKCFENKKIQNKDVNSTQWAYSQLEGCNI
jgi:predicted aminopeptidase